MGALKPKGLNSCYTMWNDAVYAILYEMMRFMLYYEQKIRIALKILELKKNI